MTKQPELADTDAAPPSDPARTTTTLQGPVARTSGAIDSLALGSQIGHFRIDAKLGAGGMGEVYRATDLALDRPVAIKVLPDGLARDPGRRDRLIREARAQARVVHPNVGHIYFIGEEGGQLYFAMELVAGETLADRVARGPLAIDDALVMIRGAALGLREAQRSGFTHRDVKPSNLMLDGHGVVKVLDFGLAAGAPDGGSASGADEGPIAQTSLAGTPLYMAPEQARGEPIDLRADIYALGATLYHLVSGDPPFKADTLDALVSLHATASRPVVPRRGRPRVAVAAIEALCARMMAPDRAARFANYDELLRAIELASTTHTRPAGFWARGLATILDLIIVSLFSLLATGGVELLSSLDGVELDGDALVFPILALYLTITIARWGKTAGKALLELEVVDMETGGRPSWGRAVVRAAMIAGVPTLASWIANLLERAGFERGRVVAEVISTFSFPILAIALLVSAVRSQGKRAPWDRVARTIVRYRRAR